jgi:hypothetical protein
MLTRQEMDFISYWRKNRLRQKKIARQLLVGIPAGLIIAVPIAINFSSDWYRRAKMEANSSDFNPIVLLVALLMIVGFIAIFYRQHKWDQYEQRYMELLIRQMDEPTPDAPDDAGNQSGMPLQNSEKLPGDQKTTEN